MKKLNHYTARWAGSSGLSIANVSFYAKNLTAAKREANKIASELRVTNTPRTITASAKVLECIQTGVSEE